MSLSLRNNTVTRFLRGQRSTGHSIVEHSPTGYPGHLSAEQSAALNELAGALAPAMRTAAGATFIERFGGRDRCLLRWLRLMKFNVPAAQRRFEETLQWRIEVEADSILENPAAIALMDKVKPYWPGAYCGQSLDGMPILFVRVGQVRPQQILQNLTEAELKVFYIYWMELSCVLQTRYIAQRAKEGKDVTVCRGQIEIYDCSALSIRQMHLHGLKLLAKMLSIGSTHYPENLYRGFIINIPSVFSMGWKVISPVLNENAKQMITVDAGTCEEPLVELIGGSHLQQVYSSVPVAGGAAALDDFIDPTQLMQPDPEERPGARQEQCPKVRLVQRTY